ncbi:MAG: DUF4838 domain-containing protein [Clostridia bacterium]|nr:DUF4838 domain-containing protein [Clostridia bacterium]
MKRQKMNFVKRIAVMLASCFLLSAFTGCGDKNSDDDNKLTNLDYETMQAVEGTHQFHVQKTSKNIVNDGATEYKVVVSENPSEMEQTALKELLYFFKEATGITLQTVLDSEVNYTDSAKYISLGNNAYTAQANVAVEAETLGDTGLTIQTKGESVFVLGAKGRGTLNAVYEFLAQAFHYEYFSSNMIQIDRNVTELPLMQYDIVDVPDYEYNVATYGYVRGSETIRNRYRMVEDKTLFIPVGGKMYHNSFEWLPKENYLENNREWYSDDKTQLCYTAHGDEKEYNLMLAAALQKAKELLSDPAYEDATILTFTQQDTQTWCECDTCVAELQKYGANSAVVVKFMNALRRLIDTWFEMDGAEYKRDFKLLFFAYHLTNRPPTVYDEATKTYKAVDSSVKCVPGVGVYFAETLGDYQQSFTEQYNREIGQNMSGWGACADDLFFWSYNVNFSHYLTPYNSFSAMQDIYKYGAMNNAHFLFDQGQYNQDGKPTGWCMLKIYLSSKLAWNVNENMEELIDKFFAAYFGPAATSMRKMFDGFRVQAFFNENNGYSGAHSVLHDAMQDKYWSRALLEDWLSLTERAMGEIESVKETNPTLYEAYKLNINIERLSPIYMLIELYDSAYSEDVVRNYQKEFLQIATEIGITRVDETKNTPANLYLKWGL